MGINLTEAEAFRIARYLEKRTSRFYHIAALAMTDPLARQLFNELSQMEDDHDHVFGAIQDELCSTDHANQFDPSWQAVLSTVLSDVEVDLVKRFQGKVSPVDIISAAMGFEKESIIFLLALKNMLPPEQKHKIDRLIQEELGHLLKLGGQMAKDQTQNALDRKFPGLGQMDDQPC